MKKLLSVIIAIIAVIALLPHSASAVTTSQQIADYVQSQNNVDDAEVVVYNNVCVVAVKCTIHSKSQFVSFKQTLCTEISRQFGVSQVFVTGNPHVMHTLKNLNEMDEAERNKTIEQLVENFSEKLKHRTHK